MQHSMYLQIHIDYQLQIVTTQEQFKICIAWKVCKIKKHSWAAYFLQSFFSFLARSAIE